MDGKSEIGLIGLGVMGKSLALNMARNGIALSVFNRHVEGKEELVAERFVNTHANSFSMAGFDDIRQFVDSLRVPRNIFLMVNAGDAVDKVIEALLPFLESDDLIIDGGNSHYKDTHRREVDLKGKGILFLGTGISGGEEGALKGPSMMPGGSKAGYERVGKFLETIAARDRNGLPCCTYLGTEGAGHFVKMVHNGIEYAEMQAIAEVYYLLRYYYGVSPFEISDIFESWSEYGANSYLLEITSDILQTKESGALLLDKILDAAKQKNTGGWTVEAAFSLGVPLTTISEAVMARFLSSKKKERVKAMQIYGEQTAPLAPGADLGEMVGQQFGAYQATRMINHASGFSLLSEASAQYNWHLNLSEIARIWTNGCIIRSSLMERLVEFLKEPTPLLQQTEIVKEMKKHVPGLQRTVAAGLQAGYAMPVLSGALNYFLGYVAGESPANLIQAQRDYFGSHTYQRKDKSIDEHFHTQWK